MKYGDALRQHSVPEWAHYNVDYDAVKHLIKECTSSGKGKALDIPGQGDDASIDAEKHLRAVLDSEHERVGLFIKSKSNEIRGRLNSIEKSLEKLRARNRLLNDGPRPYLLQRYGKLERDAISAGEEIRSLSRFIVAQRTAFRKLLKKYKKWSRASDLDERFCDEVLDRSSSFTKVSLNDVFDRWTSLLQAIRYGSNMKSSTNGFLSPDGALSPIRSRARPRSRESSSLSSKHFETAVNSANDVIFDTVFSETPVGETGSFAVYWVHHEQLIELQVLLLQYLRLYQPKTTLGIASPSSLSQSPITTRRSSLSVRQEGVPERDSDSGIIYLDDVEDYAQRLSRATVYDAEDHGFDATFTDASVAARWTSSTDNSTVTFRRTTSAPRPKLTEVRRKHLGALLDAERDFRPWQSGAVPASEDLGTLPLDRISADDARNLLERRKQLQPLVGVFSKRTRFTGLGNTSSVGQWAVLDAQIGISKVLREDLAGKDWMSNLSRDAKDFPFAVLRIRQEGTFSKNIVEVLDRSHLTERVRGFSLAHHAIWECWKPRAMSPPFWLNALSTDIRKVPDVAVVGRRASAQVLHSSQNPGTSNSSASSTGGWGSSTVAAGESSATSVPASPTIEEQELRVSIKSSEPKKKVSYAEFPVDKPSNKKKEKQRYWSEYDNPESDDEHGAYYILIDPSKEDKWFGQDAAQQLYAKVRSLFSSRDEKRSDEEQGLLRSYTEEEEDDDPSSSPTDSENESPISPSFSAGRKKGKAKDYGTLSAGPTHLSELFLPQTDTAPTASTSSRLLISALSLFASVLLCILVATLVATGRRKAQGQVEAGTLLGIAASLFFAFVALTSVLTARDRTGLFNWAWIGIVFVAVCITNGVLLASVLV